MPKVKPLPLIPGVGDLPNLLIYLEHAKQRDKWISEAKKVAEANQKAARLLGAEDKIEKDLQFAEKSKANAGKLLESAKAQAESIAEEAERKFSAREKTLLDGEKALENRINSENRILREKIDIFEAREAESRRRMEAMDADVKARIAAVSSREKAAETKEKRADSRLEEAKEMKAEAKRKAERILAAAAE